MSVNPSAHKSRYIQLSGFTQGRLRRSLAHITTVLFAISFSCRFLCFALNFSLTSIREAIKMRQCSITAYNAFAWINWRIFKGFRGFNNTRQHLSESGEISRG